MPLKNYHACRQIDPKLCTNYKTMRGKDEETGKPINLLMADYKGERVPQSIRFPVEHWTEAQARAVCHGTFHPAGKE